MAAPVVAEPPVNVVQQHMISDEDVMEAPKANNADEHKFEKFYYMPHQQQIQQPQHPLQQQVGIV
jgi:hypothetical protein